VVAVVWLVVVVEEVVEEASSERLVDERVVALEEAP
jgi:hypothetical protein